MNGNGLNINKKDFIKKISTKCALSGRQAEEGVEAILTCLSRAFERGQKIEIRGFGSFKKKKNGNVTFKSFIVF